MDDFDKEFFTRKCEHCGQQFIPSQHGRVDMGDTTTSRTVCGNCAWDDLYESMLEQEAHHVDAN
jgi:RNase P subunit RPR2